MHRRVMGVAVVLTVAASVGGVTPAAADTETPPNLVDLDLVPVGQDNAPPPDLARNPTTGDFYLTDEAADRIIHLGPTGAQIGTWGTEGLAHGQLVDPVAIAVGPDGDVYVADAGNARVERFDAAGAYEATYGGPGAGPTELATPTGVAVDAAGNVYVSDGPHDRIQKYEADGDHLATLRPTNPLRLQDPADLDLDAAGNVYVANGTASPAILQLNPAGQFVRGIGGWPLSDAGRFAVAGDGTVYWAFLDNEGVAKTTPDGVTAWTVYGFDHHRGDPEVGGVAIDGDEVYVASALVDDDYFVLAHYGEAAPTGEITAELRTDNFVRTVRLGQRLGVWAHVENTGAIPVTGLSGRFEDRCQFHLGLSPGGEDSLSCDPRPDTPGVHEIDLRVDTVQTDPQLTNSLVFGVFPAHGFTDLGNPFYDPKSRAADWAKFFAIVSGYANHTFRPKNAVTRGQWVNMLWHLVDAPTGSPPAPFNDVPASAAYRPALRWAAANGLVDGFHDGSFRGQLPVTRGQAIRTLWRLMGEPEGTDFDFADVPAQAFYRDALRWGQRIVWGFPGNGFHGAAPLTRGPALLWLHHLAVDEPSWADSIAGTPSTVIF